MITLAVSETPGRRYRILGNDLPVNENRIGWLGARSDRRSVTVPRRKAD